MQKLKASERRLPEDMKTQKDLDKFHRDQLAQQEKRDKQALAMRKARTQIAEKNGFSVKEGSLPIKLPD